MPNARQRGTGVRIRSEAKAQAADRWLLVAQSERQHYDEMTRALSETAKWRWLRRRKINRFRFVALRKFMQAITAAQEIAKKGRYAHID